MRIVHIITGLNDGGAENTLFKICKYDIENEHIVISFKISGKYYSLLNKIGVKVYSLDATFYSINKFYFLIKLLKFLKPKIVQTWLVHADFIGGIAARLAGIKNIIWNIRYSNLEIKKTKITTIIILKILKILSFFIPQYIVVNSKNGKKVFKNKNFDKKKLILIPNGYDLSILKPNKIEKKNFKKEINVKTKIPLIGYVARYDPIKDHLNLLKALSIIKSKNINFFCVLVGSNINKSKKIIKELKRLNLKDHVKLFGAQMNISKVMNGIDLHVLSSLSEGFPNVVAESMACGTPCVVTDVGDAAFIVGDNGWVLSPGDSIKLSKIIEVALRDFANNKWSKKSKDARLRIKENFDITKMIKLFNKLWNKFN